MTLEELLKPRYKVVSDWPGRRDFEVDEIVVLDKDFSPEYKVYEVEDCQGKRQYITSFFEMFPLQFRRLEWWEERDRYKEMPKYVRFVHNPGWNFKAGDIEEVFNWHKYPAACIFHNHFHASYLEPATEAEYQEYLKSKS